jgi:hypothetical protein
MGNSNSASATSTLSTPRTHKASVSVSVAVRRKSTSKSVRQSGKPPPPKTLIKTSLSNQTSLNPDLSDLNSGNVSPTQLESNGNNIRTSKSMYELRNKQSPTSSNAPLLLTQNGSLRSPSSQNFMNGYTDGAENE